jgi:cytochrome b6-f complex iron-sulfur subunit
MNRREFLFYVWSASIALSLAGTGGAILWFAYPRFREGEFGGEFPIDASALPAPDAPPEDHPDGRFWLVNTGSGILAIYKVCTHLGCLYKWVPSNDRFECPCHGSKYLTSGIRVDGPARRNLDVFVIEAVDANGNVLTRTEAATGSVDGKAIDITGAAKLRINTGRRINGDLNSAPNGGK